VLAAGVPETQLDLLESAVGAGPDADERVPAGPDLGRQRRRAERSPRPGVHEPGRAGRPTGQRSRSRARACARTGRPGRRGREPRADRGFGRRQARDTPPGSPGRRAFGAPDGDDRATGDRAGWRSTRRSPRTSGPGPRAPRPAGRSPRRRRAGSPPGRLPGGGPGRARPQRSEPGRRPGGPSPDALRDPRSPWRGRHPPAPARPRDPRPACPGGRPAHPPGHLAEGASGSRSGRDAAGRARRRAAPAGTESRGGWSRLRPPAGRAARGAAVGRRARRAPHRGCPGRARAARR